MAIGKYSFIFVVCFISFNFQARAANWNDGSGGATREYYNFAAKLPWDKKMGDWRDANGKSWGTIPFTATEIKTKPIAGKVRFNVTSLVSGWKKHGYKNEGFYLRGIKGKSIAAFYSKESMEFAVKPKLILSTSKTLHVLLPSSDTYLSSSTYKSLGKEGVIKIDRSTPVLINFDLASLQNDEFVMNATLEFTIKKLYNRGFIEIGVFQLTPGSLSSSPPQTEMGLAQNYTLDKGLESHPDVYFVTGFEERNWRKSWFDGGKMGRIKGVKKEGRYEPFSGKSLSATMRVGDNLALNQRYKFSKNTYLEPEEAYFRYYLRLGDNWNQTISGGKMPGFAGTYNKAGWGARIPNGTNGWSARGAFLKTLGPATSKSTPIGSYVYHLGQDGHYGTAWTWNKHGGALLKNNQWYSIEQYLKLNTPGDKNGILIAWLDGKKIFEKKGLQFRTSNKLKIEEVWLNVYHGGTAKSPFDQTVYIDNFVVAKKYIGPIKN